MANLVVSTIWASGSADDLERVRAAIQASAVDAGEGSECLKEYGLDREKWAVAYPDWGDSLDLWILESRYPRSPKHCYLQEDLLPVRIIDGTLIIRSVTKWDAPRVFVIRLAELFPAMEIIVASHELTNYIYEKWRLHGGQEKLLEQQHPTIMEYGITEWEKDDRVWKWTNERDADIRMLQTFLEIDNVDGIDAEDLLTACRLAYDAMAFPHAILPAQANNYAYHLASTIAEYRHALAPYERRLANERRAAMTAQGLLDEPTGARHTMPGGDQAEQENPVN